MAVVTRSGGHTIVLSADLADVAHDVNAEYPNGIGKRKGMTVIRDTGTVLQYAVARGAGTTAVWDIVGDGAAAVAVTPA